MAGTWRVMVAETVTGAIVADVTPQGLPGFTRKITDKGTWSVAVAPDDKANAGVDFHALTDSGRYSWMVLCDDFVAQAGPVWTHQFDEDSRTLSVAGSGIQGLFDRRALHAPGHGRAEVTTAAADLTITGRSLRGIGRDIMAASLAATIDYGLPIDLPAAESGTHERHYFGYDLAKVWPRLDDLSKVDGGPEFDFQPYLVSGANLLRWTALIGSPLLGDQATHAVWDYGGAVSRINVDVNGAASPCTRAYVKGSGSEWATLVGYAENPGLVALGFPPTDYIDTSHSGGIVQSELEGYAQAGLKTFAAPTETWTCSVRIDGATATGIEVSPALGRWDIGDQPTFGISGHPWIADGQYRRRILGYVSKDQSAVDLTLQPTVEVI